VDVEALARDLGLTLVREPSFHRDIAGKIVRDTHSPSGFTIYVNANDPRRRQRFTIAHEIGHFVLHRDLIGDGITDDGLYRSPLGDHMERQANALAADILMPRRLLRTLWRDGQRSLAQLANRFDVSDAALRIRLSEMKLAA
jgi:Zn-dependent peptidase ImmA (M78 family)